MAIHALRHFTGVFTGGVFTGGVITGGVITGGVITSGVITGGVPLEDPAGQGFARREGREYRAG
jgi:hypothetical protein